ncbi:MAG: lytic transglycosylase domain-containing protein [Chakrabartia sp.]
MKRFAGLGLACISLISSPALAAGDLPIMSTLVSNFIPQLGPNARQRYKDIFVAIREGRWADAQAGLDAMPEGPLHNVARAELYLAKGSPKATPEQLEAILTAAPYLPQAAQLSRLAKSRGQDVAVSLPIARDLVWLGSAPRRARTAQTGDPLAVSVNARIQPLIKENLPFEAEAIVLANEGNLTLEGRTELYQRVAWSYFITGEDDAARRLAAWGQLGVGPWAAQSAWTQGLAAWRLGEYAESLAAFQSAAARFQDDDMEAAAHFWAARAAMAAGMPQKVDGHLRIAARFTETFYGLLAADRLGLPKYVQQVPDNIAEVENLPNVRAALALAEINETDLADEIIRWQARIGDPRKHAALAALAGRMDLPATQLWLAHNGPVGAQAPASARYPMPRTWVPEGGWRVDRALVYAHALQESQFRTSVVSPAGARGLMQVMPGTAAMMARKMGRGSVGSLNNPATNMEYGQSFIERLRDMPTTGGMLPKVIAAYNAGPQPVDTWNQRSRDASDPLLYIESIPYWETRAYVTIILRNYWMYQLQANEKTASLSALSQGLWPRFPGLPGPSAVRLDRPAGIASAN